MQNKTKCRTNSAPSRIVSPLTEHNRTVRDRTARSPYSQLANEKRINTLKLPRLEKLLSVADRKLYVERIPTVTL
jgi:hypothetical protein